MRQQEIGSRRLRRGTGSKLSQSYLSQIESGARPHLTNSTRQMLTKFSRFILATWWTIPKAITRVAERIHNLEDKLDLWVAAGAERLWSIMPN